jgi:hypothetical protein
MNAGGPSGSWPAGGGRKEGVDEYQRSDLDGQRVGDHG